MELFTTTLTSGELTLNRQDGAMFISIQPSVNSICLFEGNIPFKGIQPQPSQITGGKAVSYAAQSANSPLDGIKVTHITGSIDILIGF